LTDRHRFVLFGLMQDMLDLLTFIAENMGKGEGIERIREVILEKGYTEKEMNLALNYLLLTSGAQREKGGWHKTRVLHPIESAFISPEAYGYLLKLRALGIVNGIQLERIIEEVLMDTERIVTLDELKKVVYRTLFRVQETDDPSLLSEEDEEKLSIH